MGKIFTTLAIILMTNAASAQFWSEDFSTGFCASVNLADTANTSNGNYSTLYSVGSTTPSHDWFISSREAFTSTGACGASCLTNSTLINKTLHVSTTANGDEGAVYNDDSTFTISAFTPAINCFNKYNLRIEFDYLLGSDTSDHGYFTIASSPSSFSTPVFTLELASTAGTCANSATWAHKVIYLPASYSNQIAWYLGFKFQSNGVSNGSSTSMAIDNIAVYESAPSPWFTISADSICDSNCVVFGDSTLGNVTTYNWNFGLDATPSSAVGAGPHSVCFSGAGTKTIELSTYNSIGSTSVTRNLEVVSCFAPDPAIASSDSILCQGQCIDFTNLSTNGTFGQGQWTWQFQGATPNVSTDENPQNICYANTGTYNVTLTVVDVVSGKSKTTVFTDFIEVGICSVPTASFDSDTNEICNNDFITFYSTSAGIPDTIAWYFEGGNPTIVGPSAYSTQDTVQVYYSTPGTYKVALLVKNDGGTVVDTIENYVTVNDCPTPIPSFEASDPTPCPGVPIVFTDNSLYATEWYWEFPGASPSTATTQTVVNVVYQTAGTYPVTLTVKNVNGEATLVEEAFIIVDSCLGPKPQWTVENDSICRGTCVEFFNTSLRADSIIWIFWLHPDTNLAGDTIDSLTPGYEWIADDYPLIRKDTAFDKGLNYYPMIAPIINDQSPLFCFDDSVVVGVSMIAYNNYEVTANHSPDIAVVAVGGKRPQVNAGPDKVVRFDNINSRFYLDDTVNFEGSGTGDYLAWWPEEGLSCYDCPRPIIYPTETRKYYLTAYDDYHCQSFDSVTVFVEQSYFAGIPNIFSPNGDDNNDVLWVRGNQIADEGFVMRIYDRYSNLVFESYSQNDGWDGMINGKEAPIGGYTYYVKLNFLNGETDILTGNVMLVRY